MLMALLINDPKLHVLTYESALHYDYPKELPPITGRVSAYRR